MGIVDMEHMLVCKVLERAVLCLVLRADVLQRCRNEEVLLLEAERLTLAVIILRIKDHRNGLGHCVLFDRLEVLARGEQLHVERDRALCLPQTQTRDIVRVVAGDRHIIRHGEDRGIVVIIHDQLAVLVEMGVDGAADLDLAGLVHRRNLPYIAGGEPGVRQLDLLAVLDLLLEDAVLVADGIAGAAHARGGHAVHVARRQTAQTAVAEARVSLLLEDVRHLKTHVFERCGQRVEHAEVVGIVAQAAAYEELHAQVMNLTVAVTLYLVLGLDHVFGQRVADDECACLIDLILLCVLDFAREVALQLACDGFLERSLGVLCLCHCFSVSSHIFGGAAAFRSAEPL